MFSLICQFVNLFTVLFLESLSTCPSAYSLEVFCHPSLCCSWKLVYDCSLPSLSPTPLRCLMSLKRLYRVVFSRSSPCVSCFFVIMFITPAIASEP